MLRCGEISLGPPFVKGGIGGFTPGTVMRQLFSEMYALAGANMTGSAEQLPAAGALEWRAMCLCPCCKEMFAPDGTALAVPFF